MANPLASLVHDLSAALAATMSPDATIRQQAETQLIQFKETNFPSYLSSLLAALVDDNKPADQRQAAGLLLKNAVDAKEEAMRINLQSKWRSVEETLRQAIREALLQSLHSPVPDVRRTTALVVAKIALIDLTNQEWPALIPTLLQNMSAQPHVSGTRQATLMTLGWICEEIDPNVFTPADVNTVLTAVVAGMGATEADESRLAAFEALANAIDFAERNFEVEVERNYLMQVICEGTQAQNINIRRTAFECLHLIAANYYSTLRPYILQLYELTVKAIRDDEDEVGTQAVEFWSTIAETELELEEDGEEAKTHNFIRQAAEHLVPTLLQQLTHQDEDVFENSDGHWDVSMACGSCLNLVAQVVKDIIVPMVSQFVAANIKNPDWHFREAAIYALGAVLEGPSTYSLEGFVREALPALFETLSNDPHPYVRNTTAYALSRVFANLHGSDKGLASPLVRTGDLPTLLKVLSERLQGDFAQNGYYICEAIRYLALGYEGESESPLTPYLTDMIQQLLQAAERADANATNKLATAAYEAINDLIRCSTAGSKAVIQQLITHVVGLLDSTFQTPVASQEQHERLCQKQGNLCGMLQVCMQRITDLGEATELVMPLAPKVAETLVKVLQSSKGSGSVFEDAMLALSAFVVATDEAFSNFLPHFYPFLIVGLQNHQEWQVCSSTIGALGDVCRSVGKKIAPHCDEIVQVLLTNLGNAQLHRNVKPELLGCFSDLTVAIEGDFAKYLETVLAMLDKAMNTSAQMAADHNEDDVDYNNALRAGILNAFVGVVNYVIDDPALKDTADGHAALQVVFLFLPALVNFICSIGKEAAAAAETGYADEFSKSREDVDRDAVALFADLCRILPGFGQQLANYHDRSWINVVKAAQVAANNNGDAGNLVEQSVAALSRFTQVRF